MRRVSADPRASELLRYQPQLPIHRIIAFSEADVAFLAEVIGLTSPLALMDETGAAIAQLLGEPEASKRALVGERRRRTLLGLPCVLAALGGVRRIMHLPSTAVDMLVAVYTRSGGSVRPPAAEEFWRLSSPTNYHAPPVHHPLLLDGNSEWAQLKLDMIKRLVRLPEVVQNAVARRSIR